MIKNKNGVGHFQMAATHFHYVKNIFENSLKCPCSFEIMTTSMCDQKILHFYGILCAMQFYISIFGIFFVLILVYGYATRKTME